MWLNCCETIYKVIPKDQYIKFLMDTQKISNLPHSPYTVIFAVLVFKPEMYLQNFKSKFSTGLSSSNDHTLLPYVRMGTITLSNNSKHVLIDNFNCGHLQKEKALRFELDHEDTVYIL